MRGALLLLAITAGCYAPHAPSGVACSPESACPSGQACDLARNICVAIGTTPDAAADADIDAPPPTDAAPDAPPDAPPTLPPQLRAYRGTDGTAATTLTPSPPGIMVGDLLLAHVVQDASTSANIPTPAGWTRLLERDNPENTFCAAVFYRFVTDPTATYSWTFTSTYNAIYLIAVAGVDPAAPIHLSAGGITPGTMPPTAPAITTTIDATLVISLFTQDLSTAPLDAGPGLTEIYDEFTGSLIVMAGHAPIGTAGAVPARIATTTDAGPAIGLTIALAPE